MESSSESNTIPKAKIITTSINEDEVKTTSTNKYDESNFHSYKYQEENQQKQEQEHRKEPKKVYGYPIADFVKRRIIHRTRNNNIIPTTNNNHRPVRVLSSAVGCKSTLVSGVRAFTKVVSEEIREILVPASRTCANNLDKATLSVLDDNDEDDETISLLSDTDSHCKTVNWSNNDIDNYDEEDQQEDNLEEMYRDNGAGTSTSNPSSSSSSELILIDGDIVIVTSLSPAMYSAEEEDADSYDVSTSRALRIQRGVSRIRQCFFSS